MNIKTALDNYLGKSVRFSEQDNGNGTKEVCDLDTGECYVVREKDGLAMSSRNVNLTSDERSAASLIPEVLQKVKEKISTIGLFETKKWVFNCFQNHMILKLEYFEIADSESLEISTENIFESKNLRAFIVVYAGKTRLIDNVDLN